MVDGPRGGGRAGGGESPGTSSLGIAGDPASEVVRLRERLRYYESFDRLIQENIARSGEMMREAADLRERTLAEMALLRKESAAIRADTEGRVRADQDAQRATLSAFLDELATVQQATERLRQRLEDAVRFLGPDPAALPGGTGSPAVVRVDVLASGDLDGDASPAMSLIDPFRVSNEIDTEHTASPFGDASPLSAGDDTGTGYLTGDEPGGTPPDAGSGQDARVTGAGDADAPSYPATEQSFESQPSFPPSPADAVPDQAGGMDGEVAAWVAAAEASSGPTIETGDDAGDDTSDRAGADADGTGGAADDESAGADTISAGEALPEEDTIDEPLEVESSSWVETNRGTDELPGAGRTGDGADAYDRSDDLPNWFRGGDGDATSLDDPGLDAVSGSDLVGDGGGLGTGAELVPPTAVYGAPADGEPLTPFVWFDEAEDETDDGDVSEDSVAGDDELVALFGDADDAVSLAAADAGPDQAVVPSSDETTEGDDPGDGLTAGPDDVTPMSDAQSDTEVRSVTVLVHGVPRAATALSLQRHLANLPHVDGVEAREYAEGVLRLHVMVMPALHFHDVEDWADEDGARLESVHIQDDVLELRLPSAGY